MSEREHPATPAEAAEEHAEVTVRIDALEEEVNRLELRMQRLEAESKIAMLRHRREIRQLREVAS